MDESASSAESYTCHVKEFPGGGRSWHHSNAALRTGEKQMSANGDGDVHALAGSTEQHSDIPIDAEAAVTAKPVDAVIAEMIAGKKHGEGSSAEHTGGAHGSREGNTPAMAYPVETSAMAAQASPTFQSHQQAPTGSSPSRPRRSAEVSVLDMPKPSDTVAACTPKKACHPSSDPNSSLPTPSSAYRRPDNQPTSTKLVAGSTTSKGTPALPTVAAASTLATSPAPLKSGHSKSAVSSPKRTDQRTPIKRRHPQGADSKGIAVVISLNDGIAVNESHSSTPVPARRRSQQNAAVSPASASTKHGTSGGGEVVGGTGSIAVISPNAGSRSHRHSSMADDCSFISYNRSYELSVTDHNAAPPDVSVNRYIQTARPPVWSSNFKGTDSSPKEELPRIHTTRKGKYDVLMTGESPSAAQTKQRKQLHQHRSTAASCGISTNAGAAAQKARNGRVMSFTSVNSNTRASASAYEYAEELYHTLSRIDFSKALSQEENGLIEGTDYKLAVEVFRTVSRGKQEIHSEDLHELLLLFTPPGVALHEATDFMIEECEGLTRLSFPAFLVFGKRIRNRVFEYSTVAELQDDQRILVMYARVFPGEPSTEPEDARICLLKAYRLQLEDQLPDKCRPLRVHEHMFLVDLQNKLYSDGAIRANEVPPDTLGDLSSSAAHKAQRKQRQKQDQMRGSYPNEEVDWGWADREERRLSTTSSEERRCIEASAAAARVKASEYPALAKCNEKQLNQPQQHQHHQQDALRGGTRTLSKTAQANSTVTTSTKGEHGGTRRGTRGDHTSGREMFPGSVSMSTRISRDSKSFSKGSGSHSSKSPPFDTTLRVGETNDRKVIDRPVEEEYLERRKHDNQLVRKLQATYGAGAAQ